MDFKMFATVSLISFLITFADSVNGLPSQRFREADDGSVTTRVIDLNNPEDEGLLRQFNISAEQLKHIRSTAAASSELPSTQDDDRRLSDIKEMRFQDIKNKIENAINGHGINYDNLPIHEMAAYPTCGQINETSWQQENNITIRFAASLFENTHPDMYLDTAVLRLFKLNPQHPHHPEMRTTPRPYTCDESAIESQIRVTVSTIQHLKRNKRANNPFDYSSVEKKKRICNTVMLNISQTGWVEIDVKKAINLWEKAERQSRNANYNSNNSNRMPVMVGWLTIEVHDEEERPLKAGLYFAPPKCSEAYPAIPWNFYRQYSSWPSTDMEAVPRSPRLDIKLIDFRSVVPHRHTNTHSSHHNHRSFYHHDNNASPLTSEQSTTTDNLLDSTETRTHRRRHEQSHHSHQHHHHHHHHPERHTTSDDSSSED